MKKRKRTFSVARRFRPHAVLIVLFVVILLNVAGGQGVLRLVENKTQPAMLKTLLAETLPLSVSDSWWQRAGRLLLGFDAGQPFSLLAGQLAALPSVAASPPEPNPPSAPQPTPSQSPSPIKEITINQTGGGLVQEQGVLIKNNTAYSFNAKELLDGKLDFKLTDSGPQILIVQSHASEAYSPTDRNYYLPTDPDRTEDVNFNVVRVGEELANTLKGMGYNVIHDKTMHDYPSYNGSYQSSLATVNKYLKEYPSIRIVLDVHRDAMVQADGTKLKVSTKINNKKAAQVMIVTGSDQGGLNHPNWQKNLQFSMKLQRRINLLYPTLTRPIHLAKERYNTHTTAASIILEIGSNGNTLEEALVCAQMVGHAMGDMLKYLK